jgi:hypothetical protein
VDNLIDFYSIAVKNLLFRTSNWRKYEKNIRFIANFSVSSLNLRPDKQNAGN